MLGAILPWKELKEIRASIKGRRQCGVGDFHRMENILNSHKEKIG